MDNAFHRAQVASEATFHTAVSGAAINNLAKIFRLNFFKSFTNKGFVYKTQKSCMNMPSLEVTNSSSGKGTSIQNKKYLQFKQRSII